MFTACSGDATGRAHRVSKSRAAAGLIVAYPSFRTRGDYLAIVTLAFNMIVKSVLENIDAEARRERVVGRRPTPAQVENLLRGRG